MLFRSTRMSARELRVEGDRTSEHLARALEALAPKLMKQLPASEVQLIGLRVVCAEWHLRIAPRRSPMSEPFVELGTNGVDRAQFEVQLTMNRQVFGPLPALHGANVPMQVGRNLLPPA